MNAESKQPSFSEALSGIEDILGRLERDEIGIDALGDEVKRAVDLVAFCRGKLKETETEVRDLVTGLQEDEPEPTS